MITIEKFKPIHLDDVTNVEKQCFTINWTREMLEEELKSSIAIYFVALDNKKVVGYGGMWKIVDEAHITNIAVLPNYRRRGIGKMLLEKLISEAEIYCLRTMMLEVRASNIPAQELYKKYGFTVVGNRKEYYIDNNEDALLMTRERINF